jgi:hypothetical protein
VIQRSFDGTAPADYVLFDFSICNIGKQTLTFYAGFFGDWDVGQFTVNDDGFTELGGRLMYATDEGATGVHVGTLFHGDIPVSGNYLFNNASIPSSLTEQVDALRGALIPTRSPLPATSASSTPSGRSRSRNGKAWMSGSPSRARPKRNS